MKLPIWGDQTIQMYGDFWRISLKKRHEVWVGCHIMTLVVGNVEVVSPQNSWKNSGIPLVLLRKRWTVKRPRFGTVFFGTPPPAGPRRNGFQARSRLAWKRRFWRFFDSVSLNQNFQRGDFFSMWSWRFCALISQLLKGRCPGYALTPSGTAISPGYWHQIKFLLVPMVCSSMTWYL